MLRLRDLGFTPDPRSTRVTGANRENSAALDISEVPAIEVVHTGSVHLMSEFLSPSLGSPEISATSAIKSLEEASVHLIAVRSPLASASRMAGSASPLSCDY